MRPRSRAGAVAAAAVATLLLASGCGDDDGSQSASGVDGKVVFAKASCGSCHTLADAGATGTIGVNFDAAKPNARKVEQFVRNGSPPTMPAFEGTLTDAEIVAVALYVQEATGAEPVEE